MNRVLFFVVIISNLFVVESRKAIEIDTYSFLGVCMKARSIHFNSGIIRVSWDELKIFIFFTLAL